MSNQLLNEEIANQLRKLFEAQLIHPVEIKFFSKIDSCDTCEEIKQLLEEVTAISRKLNLSVHSIEDDSELAKRYQVELAPSLVVTGCDGEKDLDYHLRFAGIPSGYEFSSFIQAILMVSKRDSGLKPEIRQALKAIKEPIHLQVFVTPT